MSMSNYPYNPAPASSSAGPTYTTISIAPQPGTQSTAASYSGNLNLTPSGYSGMGVLPNYGGMVTLTPNTGLDIQERVSA